MEILALGFAAPNQQGGLCADPTPNAVIRIQRLRDTGLAACTAANYGGSLIGTDYWPNMLFDAREGSTRLLATNATMALGGVVSYIALDVNNFRRWVTGAIGATGNLASNNDGNGYIVYFSDRRGNHDPALAGALETGEYGFEDSLNPLNAVWAKDNVLNGGEDFNQNTTLQSYGENPWAATHSGLHGLPVGRQRPPVDQHSAHRQRVGAHESPGAVPPGAQDRQRRDGRRGQQRAGARLHGGLREPGLRAGQLQLHHDRPDGGAERRDCHHRRRDHAALERLHRLDRRSASRTT